MYAHIPSPDTTRQTQLNDVIVHVPYQYGKNIVIAVILSRQWTGTNVRYGHSSHEELPEQFTDAPYMAGTCVTVVHQTKNYQHSLLALYIRLVRALQLFVTRRITRAVY